MRSLTSFGSKMIPCALVAVVLFSASSNNVNGQSPGAQVQLWDNVVSEPWFFDPQIPAHNIAEVQKRWTLIEEENRQSPNSWAGDYFEGTDTHGSYLRWSPINGFVLLHVDKCAATVMSVSYGKVLSPGDVVQLVTEVSVSKKTGHSHGSRPRTDLITVRFRGSRYLVPRQRISAFGDYVAGLGTYNEWLTFVEAIPFFEQLSNAEPQPEGSSRDVAISAPYRRYIKQPIEVTVVAVGKGYRRASDNPWWDDWVTPVTFTANRKGIRSGMRFRILDSDDLIQVTNPRTLRGIIVRTIRKKPCVKFADDDDCSEVEYAPITTNLKASTDLFL